MYVKYTMSIGMDRTYQCNDGNIEDINRENRYDRNR